MLGPVINMCYGLGATHLAEGFLNVSISLSAKIARITSRVFMPMLVSVAPAAALIITFLSIDYSSSQAVQESNVIAFFCPPLIAGSRQHHWQKR